MGNTVVPITRRGTVLGGCSSVGLVGYAQVDPKVEYKREGMKLFEQMWHSIGDQSTSLIFKMEQLNEELKTQLNLDIDTTHWTEEEGIDAEMVIERIKQAADEAAAAKVARYSPDIMRQVETLVLEEQAVDWLLGQAAVTDKPTTFKDLMHLHEHDHDHDHHDH